MAVATGAIKLMSFAAVTATVKSTDAGQPLKAMGGTGDWELPAGAIGGIFVLDLSTVTPGATGGTFRIEMKDEVSGKYIQINATPAAVNSAATFTYVVYPGAGTTPGSGSGLTVVTDTCFLPPKGRVQFVVTDGTFTGTCSLTPLIQ